MQLNEMDSRKTVGTDWNSKYDFEAVVSHMNELLNLVPPKSIQN